MFWSAILLPCHLQGFDHCVHKAIVHASAYKEILEHYMIPLAEHIFGDEVIVFEQHLAPAHSAKSLLEPPLVLLSMIF